MLTSLVMLLFLVCSVDAQEVAPDFTLSDIDGVEFSIRDYRGKVVLLDFFSIYCLSCEDEILHLKSLHEEFIDDLVIISISVSFSSDTVEELQQFRQKHGIDWIVARDTVGINDEHGYNVTLLPTLVIIDQEGYTKYRHVDLTDESVLRGEINEIMPEFGADIDGRSKHEPVVQTLIAIVFLFLTITVAVLVYKRKLLKTPVQKTLVSFFIIFDT